MTQNKLISLISSFSKEDWSYIRNYITSKSGSNSDNRKLLDYLYKYRAKWPDDWNSEVVKEKLLPQVSSKAFLNIMSLLYKWSTEALLIRRTLNDELKRRIGLLQEFTERGLYHLGDSEVIKIEKRLTSMDHESLEYHESAISYYHTLYYSDNPIKYKRGSELLSSLIEHQLRYSALKNQIYLTELMNWERIASWDGGQLKSDLIKIVKADILPVDHFLQDLLRMVEDADYNCFLRLSDHLYNKEESRTGLLHKLLVFYLISWSMKFWQKGDITDTKVITELYDYGLNSGVLLSAGKMPHQRFHNIVSTIGGLSENGWSFRFIDEWGPKVESKDPEQNMALARAQVYFYKSKYSEITPLLRSLKFESHGQQTRLMGLQLISLFEGRDEYYDMFIQYAANFKRYLKRHERNLSVHYHDSHMNLVGILEKLAVKDISSGRVLYNEASRLIYRVYLKNLLKIE